MSYPDVVVYKENDHLICSPVREDLYGHLTTNSGEKLSEILRKAEYLHFFKDCKILDENTVEIR